LVCSLPPSGYYARPPSLWLARLHARCL
jgi:hypothetical protein